MTKIEEILGIVLAGSGFVHRVEKFPSSVSDKVVSIKRSDSELIICYTHGDTDIETTIRHPIDSLEIKKDEETGEIQITSTNGTTVIKPSKR